MQYIWCARLRERPGPAVMVVLFLVDPFRSCPEAWALRPHDGALLGKRTDYTSTSAEQGDACPQTYEALLPEPELNNCVEPGHETQRESHF